MLTGSDLAPKLDAELAELLPDLLWLHLMVVVLYWVFDRTPDTARTREFVRRSTPFAARVIALSRYRAFRPLVRDATSLIQEFILPTIRNSPSGRRGRPQAPAALRARPAVTGSAPRATTGPSTGRCGHGGGSVLGCGFHDHLRHHIGRAPEGPPSWEGPRGPGGSDGSGGVRRYAVVWR